MGPVGSEKNPNGIPGVNGDSKALDKGFNASSKHGDKTKGSDKEEKGDGKGDGKSESRPNDYDDIPKGPWGDRGVTSPKAGTKKPPEKDSSLNVRINLDLRADVALELHAVIQGDVTIGLF